MKRVIIDLKEGGEAHVTEEAVILKNKKGKDIAAISKAELYEIYKEMGGNEQSQPVKQELDLSRMAVKIVEGPRDVSPEETVLLKRKPQVTKPENIVTREGILLTAGGDATRSAGILGADGRVDLSAPATPSFEGYEEKVVDLGAKAKRDGFLR
jgi:hypothetical protein